MSNENSSAPINVNVYVDRINESVVAFGQFDELYNAYRAHRLALNQDISPEIESNMEVALSAALLFLASQPPDLFTAWTLNMKEPLCNYFIAGDNRDKKLVGRVFTKDVKLVENDTKGRIFQQLQRPHMSPSTSAVEVQHSDILQTFEEFFNRSQQIPTRLFETATGQFTFIQGLPLVKRDWIMGLTKESAAAYIAGNTLELVEERHYSFACGCSEEMIIQMLRQQFKEHPDQLFLNDAHVDVTCPRCGINWAITKEAFKSYKG